MSTSLFHAMLQTAIKKETSALLHLPQAENLPLLGKKTLTALSELTLRLSQKQTGEEERPAINFLQDSAALFKKAAGLAEDKPLLPSLRKPNHFPVGKEVYAKVFVFAGENDCANVFLPFQHCAVRCVGFQKSVVIDTSYNNFRHVNTAPEYVTVSQSNKLASGEFLCGTTSPYSDLILSPEEFLFLSETASGDPFHQLWKINTSGGGGPFEVKK